MKKTYLYFGNAPKIISRRFRMDDNIGRHAAYKTDGKTAEELEVERKERKKTVDAAEKAWKDCPVDSPENVVKSLNLHAAFLKAQGEENVKNYEEKQAALEAAVKEAKDADAAKLKEISERLEATIKALDIVQVRMKGQSSQSAQLETKSFNEILSETIKGNFDEIKNFRRGDKEKKFTLKGFSEEDLKMGVKAVGDMSIPNNFPGATPWLQDRQGLITTPFERAWLADILPNGTTQGTSILYPKENGGEGGADMWLDKSLNKPQIDYDFTTQSAFVKWIAGIVIVEREMLDDLAWLESYIASKMLISLKMAENKLILNGTADANPVQGMLAAATAYSGTLTAPVDKIIDAGWGQIIEDTFDEYNPTHVLMRPRDAVKIGLNKAAGSGEYDLPQGSVAFSNGKLTVGGIQNITSTLLAANNYVVFDRSAQMFIRRMQPELRMFEDSELAKKNKIMFRIEERATHVVFNDKAIVKGTLV